VSSVKSAAEMVDRIEKFLVDYFQELKKMTPAEFLVEVVGLATIKLEMHESLADACGSLWGEIRDGRYMWQVEREEVLCLRNITKEQVLEAYEEWFLPTKDGKANKRRMLAVQVIGCGEGAASAGRPDVDDSMVGGYADECIDTFYKTVGKQVWGRIY
jgi:secreted Zn-dependent insulinase-like peptidase